MNRKLTSRASTPSTPRADCKFFYSILLCTAIFSLLVLPPSAHAQHLTGRIKGTVKITTEATDAPPASLVGARLTLVNRDLTEQVFKVVTDAVGNFIFTDLPAATFVLTVEADGLATVRREISLAPGVGLTVEIVMKATISETVTIREEEGLLSTAETTTSNTVRSQTLTDVPLPAENYQSAPLLTPGVLRGMDGVDHQKGARAGQSSYTVNGVDITDPVTGNLAFDIPLEAAANVRTEENPYSAVFGRLTGGATDLETKGGGNKFKVTAARVFPTFRNTFAGSIDSFRPRVTFSGPVARDRFFFLQSLEYRFTRTRVPSLEPPGDDSTSEAFNSFTQFDFNINKTNSAKFVAALFPQKVRFAGLNTFNPQPTTPNTKQRGLLVSISEQAIFKNASFLSSTLSYKTFDFDVFGQGTGPLELLPEGNTGNYFADIRRRSQRFQWREVYYSHGLEFHGQHSLKLGGEIDYSRVTGVFHENSILIRRQDLTLARRIDFGAAASVSSSLSEFTAFAHDRWVVNKKLTVDAGLRLDRDGLARQNTISPRLSFLYLPIKNHATVIRGGIGLFYDRTPLSVGYFTQLPERTVTTFAADGISITEGPHRFANIVAARLRNPRSVRASLQIDFPITSTLTGRIGYLQRSTRDDFIVDSINASGGLGQSALVLSNLGRSRYRELQLLAIYDNPRIGTLNATYVWSKARGDLNSIDNFLGDFPAFVVRPNEYGPQPFDATHRFLAYGQFRMRYDINIAPLVEIRSGFPFSFVNERLDFVGPRNRAGRFPTFLSLALQVTKGFAIPKFVPRIGGRRTRIGLAVLNTTNHFNPSEVQNNITSPRLGQFFNSFGASVRGKFEFDF
ncbi:MAG TPA: carboxypeptidase regulatory-like domain-containing protein [Pyrinomonadaceae bacterium]|nr:carboxypeptidase regulatory-like domain-containing protein [Pyrinomonadaceae bacterium]